MNGAGSGLVPPGQVSSETEIVRGCDLPDGTAVQAKVGDAVEIFGEDRRCPGGAVQEAQNSGSGQGEIGSIDLVHGLLGLVVVKSNFVFFPVLISLRDRDSD